MVELSIDIRAKRPTCSRLLAVVTNCMVKMKIRVKGNHSLKPLGSYPGSPAESFTGTQSDTGMDVYTVKHAPIDVTSHSVCKYDAE